MLKFKGEQIFISTLGFLHLFSKLISVKIKSVSKELDSKPNNQNINSQQTNTNVRPSVQQKQSTLPPLLVDVACQTKLGPVLVNQAVQTPPVQIIYPDDDQPYPIAKKAQTANFRRLSSASLNDASVNVGTFPVKKSKYDKTSSENLKNHLNSMAQKTNHQRSY